MVQNPPAGMPRVIPYLHYTALPAALDWLERAFGLRRTLVMPGPDGSPMHAEMVLADGVIMMGPEAPEHDARSPQALGVVHSGLYIYVDELDAHYERAKAAGAKIVMPLEEMFWGDRMYTVLDLEGHHWSFAQHVRDVPPEQMKPPGM